MTFILSFLRGYWKELLFVIVLSIAVYKVYDYGYDSGYAKYETLVAQMEKEKAEAALAKAEAKTEVLIKYKDRIVYVEKKSGKVRSDIENGVLNEEAARCSIGPKFIGLHNQSAKD